MNERVIKYPESLNAKLIALCGMNCGLCIGYRREKNRCPGCNGDDANKPRHCAECRTKHCAEKGTGKQKFCFACAKFPCARLRQLDKRYRTKYGMNMIANLESIRRIGIKEFVIREKERWQCPECGGVICFHRKNCIHCGRTRS